MHTTVMFVSHQITAYIERRTWYQNGKYLGRSSPCFWNTGETAKELTGHVYGEWQDMRDCDGAAVIRSDLQRAIEDRTLLLENHPDSALGEQHCCLIQLGGWGQEQFATLIAANKRDFDTRLVKSPRSTRQRRERPLPN